MLSKKDLDKPLIECVPNISSGRNSELIKEIENTLNKMDGVMVLHTDSGVDANRTVITYVTSEDAAIRAATSLCDLSLDAIDLSKHLGTHPYTGAMDVFPFIPFVDINMKKVNALSVAFAKLIADRHHLPVYLYNQSQDKPYRKELSQMRKGGLPGLKERINHVDWNPDFGPSEVHSKYGAMVIGARDFLVAFNVNLVTNELKIAKEVAKSVRESAQQPTSLATVKALGWKAPTYRNVQVSTNLTNFREVNLVQAYDAITQQARLRDCNTSGSELIGLTPLRGMALAAENQPEEAERVAKYLGLNSVKKFEPTKQILEWRFERLTGKKIFI